MKKDQNSVEFWSFCVPGAIRFLVSSLLQFTVHGGGLVF